MSGYEGAHVVFDLSEIKAFVKKLEGARDSFKERFPEWLAAAADELLDIIRKEIVLRQTIDTRRLLEGFGVLNVSDGGLTIEWI
jgi:hypothetical protein